MSKLEKIFVILLALAVLFAISDLMSKKAEPTTLPAILKTLPKTLQTPPDINSEYCKRFDCDKL